MVISSFRLFPVKERRAEVLGILRAVLGPTRVKPQCIAAQLYAEDGYDEAILYLEEWGSDQEFCKHLRSDLYRQLLEAVELSRRKPEIRFRNVSRTRGIDLVEEMRTQGAEKNSTVLI